MAEGGAASIPKACIFDIGGVVVGSPLVGINEYEKERGLPFNYLNVAITQTGKGGAFQRLERSEIDMYTFYEAFGKELSQVEVLNRWFTEFCEARGTEVPKLPSELKVDGRELFGLMMKQSTKFDTKMVSAIEKLRASGKFKVAALTNNFNPPTHSSDGGQGNTNGSGKGGGRVPSLEEELEHLGIGEGGRKLRALFHHYIESAKVGMRKPEEGFYRHALDLLGVKPEETVFLDDIGLNLKAAQKLGIRTIRVSPKSSVPALEELEKVVEMKLLDDDGSSGSASRAKL